MEYRAEKSPSKTVYTIGHSNRSTESFLKLLSDIGIQVLVDVRSIPRSKVASQFDSALLKVALAKNGIKYLYFGREIGGRPSNPALYDAEGHALYNLIAQSPIFLTAIERLIKGLEKYRVVIMCSEEDPTECHRRLLIGRVLSEKGVQELHIRADGRVQTEGELSNNPDYNQNKAQLGLLVFEKEEKWRSVKPIRLDLQNEQQKDSIAKNMKIFYISQS
jgi:uncharacterized protein (DUF488 family)